MVFQAVPLDMINAPNYYSVLPNNRWEIMSPNAQTLWLQLQIVDGLGARRYMVAGGAVLQVIFQRMDTILEDSLNNLRLTNTPNSITKTAAVSADDRSLFSVALTPQDIQNILSGATKFTLTEGSTTTTWLFDWSIFKTLTDPGF